MVKCRSMKKSPRPHRSIPRSVIALLTFALFLPGCGTSRPAITDDVLMQRRADYAQSYLDNTSVRYTAVLNRNKKQLDEFKAGKRPEAPTIDYLVISGGGDIGAIGAGFLKGWASVPKWNPLARPRFDLVTGVSTGALIAPFAWLNDPAADDQVLQLYRNPGKDWVKERWPLYFLPHNVSFAEVPGLERELKKNFSKELIARIASADEEH